MILRVLIKVLFYPITRPPALHRAVLHRDIQKVKWLLSRGANVNGKNEDGCIALHVAATLDFVEIADLLLANGADINAKDNHGQTPIQASAKRPSKGTTVLLIARGASVNEKFIIRYGRFASLQYAKEIAELLLANGAKDVRYECNRSLPTVASPPIK